MGNITRKSSYVESIRKPFMSHICATPSVLGNENLLVFYIKTDTFYLIINTLYFPQAVENMLNFV